MAIDQKLSDVLAALDKATNDIGARIDALTAKIGTGMSQADVDAVVSSLQAEVTRLNGLAADPANPVPPNP